MVSIGLQLFLIPAAIVVYLATLLAIVAIKRALFRRRVSIVLARLRQAVWLDLPIDEFLITAAREERGKTRAALLGIAFSFREGHGIARSLQLNLPRVPLAIIRSIEAGQETSMLDETFDTLAEPTAQADNAVAQDAIFYRTYLVLIVPILWWLLTFQATFVWPKFRQILRDFHLPLPTYQLMIFHSFDQWQSAFVILMIILLTLLSGLLFLQIAAPGIRISSRGKPWSALAWYLPLGRQVIQSAGLGIAFRWLARGVQAGLPIDQGVENAARVQAHHQVEKQLQAWAERLSRGEPLPAAARAAALPKLVWALLANVQSDEDLINIFSFLQRHYSSRFSRITAVLQSIITPLMVVLAGAVVMVLAFTIFQPMIMLLNAVGARQAVFP